VAVNSSATLERWEDVRNLEFRGRGRNLEFEAVQQLYHANTLGQELLLKIDKEFLSKCTCE
jgi:hypothetical protein